MSHVNQILIQTIAALKADATLSGLLSSYAGQPSVFTHVPQDLGEAYPWVTIYSVESNQFDNDATLGFDCSMTVHSWSNIRDMGSIETIKQAIYNVLHNNTLAFDGFCSVEYCQEFQTTLRDSDGITLHGVQRFKIIVQEG